MKNKFTLTIVVMSLLLCNSATAQIYKFRQLSAREGLCHQFVYSIEQDKHGFIWFATGLGLCRFDGLNFTTPQCELPTDNVNTSFKDSNGNLWFGYSNGLTVKYDGIDFAVVDTSVTKTAVTQIIQAPDGEILIATQTGGIARIKNKNIERFENNFEDVMINALSFAENDKIIVGNFDGLFLYSYSDNPTLLASADELEYLSIVSIKPNKNESGFWVATADDGIFFVTIDGNNLTTTPLDIPELYYAQIQAIHEDDFNCLWISTFGQGLLRINLTSELTVTEKTIFNSSNGMGSDNAKQAFFDKNNNLWVATFGQGVAGITNFAFSFFDDIAPVDNNATAIYSFDDAEYWIAGIGTIIKKTVYPEPKTTIFGRANGLPADRITAMRKDNNGDLWIGTEKSGLYKLPKNTQLANNFFSEENSLSNNIQSLIVAEEKIWMATRNGVIAVNSQNKQKTDHFTTFEGGLPHNEIRDIFKDSKDRIWIATNSNSLINVRDSSRLFLQNDYETAIFSSIAEDQHGRIWAGTIGRGVYMFDEQRDTVYNVDSNGGLVSDFCYAISFDGNKQIWVGHRLGISSINTERFTVNTFGSNHGIFGDVNPLAMKLNNSGELLIGMTDGLMKYVNSADKKDEQPPILNLTRLLINDVSYCVQTPVVKKFGRYKIQLDFVGLNYSDPNSVLYQYYLHDYDMNWSQFSDINTIIYPRIEDGNYTFWVRACNTGMCTDQTLLFSLTIRKPFWKTVWFLIFAVIAAVAIVYFIITVRERNIRKLQEYLEKELQSRTKLVHKQKEEIERKNKDITDSINYAQRIQFSVLPTTATLLDHCSEAFIFYRPRDIVSGDFYWFDYFPEKDRLLIVCADSTGHGVPGAFMSLIGTTLIKDITRRRDVENPADFLYQLDRDVQSTLNQNRDSEQTQDGMDVVVCEINTRTLKIKVAAAMRPFVIYKDDNRSVYKGSRASIGGHTFSEEKVFDINEIQLAKGDIIYMFTDGYADQFGGPDGKKMKTSRLHNILNDIHNRDMDEQRRVLQENFDLWKGDNEQIDDVLIIGVKI